MKKKPRKGFPYEVFAHDGHVPEEHDPAHPHLTREHPYTRDIHPFHRDPHPGVEFADRVRRLRW
jgi:hypothetical protein